MLGEVIMFLNSILILKLLESIDYLEFLHLRVIIRIISMCNGYKKVK